MPSPTSGEPRQLIGALFPHDDDVTERKLARWMTELSDAGLLACHRTHDGMRVVRIVGWAKHQQVKNPGKPFLMRVLADPPEEDARQVSGKTAPTSPRITPESTATLPRSSGDTTEDVVRVSVDSGGAEVGSRKEGRGKREGGKEGRGEPLAPDGARAANEPSPERSPPRPAASWPGRLAQVWTESVGTVDPGRLGRELKPLVAKHGEALIARAIRHYGRQLLDDGRLRYASPGDFARTAAQWIDDASPIGERVAGGVP